MPTAMVDPSIDIVSKSMEVRKVLELKSTWNSLGYPSSGCKNVYVLIYSQQLKNNTPDYRAIRLGSFL